MLKVECWKKFHSWQGELEKQEERRPAAFPRVLGSTASQNDQIVSREKKEVNQDVEIHLKTWVHFLMGLNFSVRFGVQARTGSGFRFKVGEGVSGKSPHKDRHTNACLWCVSRHQRMTHLSESEMFAA